MQSKRYVYSHADCGGAVRKEPTGYSGEARLYSGLHGWSCLSCGKRGVKIQRSLTPKRTISLDKQSHTHDNH